jgi:hypothetical protein
LPLGNGFEQLIRSSQKGIARFGRIASQTRGVYGPENALAMLAGNLFP